MMHNPQGASGVFSNYNESASVEEIITSARLPQPLADTVRLVIKKARLRKS